MPIETVPGSELKYYLVCFDGKARERTDDPDGIISQRVSEVLTSEPITDVFVISHGWMGDIPAAKMQYNRWLTAMAANTTDIAQIREVRPGFRPLIIGLHWPSLPFGDEELGGGAMSFAAPSVGGEEGDMVSVREKLIEQYSDRLADTPAAREALQTIIDEAMEDIAPEKLSSRVIQAYEILDRETGLGSDGPAGAPGEDREPFDPVEAYRAAQDEMVSFAGASFGGLLHGLRLLSFWKMKSRARDFSQSAVVPLLNNLQQNVDVERQIRFHLMGHSFGCIVMSAALAGPDVRNTPMRSVDSAFLIQGALSLWSYAAEIPYATGRQGYFHSLVAEHKIAGPIVTTQSEFDTAVGTLYPLAAGMGRHIHFAPGELPKYGALGTFGMRGNGTDPIDMEMLPMGSSYAFERGRIYNLESSEFIREGSGLSGAHSDIAHPEVAHAFWQAVMSS